MSIRLTCPNGHALKVADSLAGKTGLCPACKARVAIPKPEGGDISDDDVLGILGNNGAPPAWRPPAPQPAKPAPARADGDAASTHNKTCIKCRAEINAAMHICPHCHTYVAKVADVLHLRKK